MSQDTFHQNEVNDADNYDNNDYDNYDNDYQKPKKQRTRPEPGTFRRIVIVDIPDYRDVNRNTIEELCSKFGKVNSIELRRAGRGKMKAYVTYLYTNDADFAVYRLTNYNFRGATLRAYGAPLSEEDIKKRKDEQIQRERERISGGEMSEKKKRAKEKPKKGSLRFLAPTNIATDVNTVPNPSNQNVRRQTTPDSPNTGSPKQNYDEYYDKRRVNKNNSNRRNKNQPRYQQKSANNNNNENDQNDQRDLNTHSDNEEEVPTPPTPKKNYHKKYEVLIKHRETEEIVHVFYLSQEDLDQHFPDLNRRKEN